MTHDERRRRNRTDDRSTGDVIAYIAEAGEATAVTGDELAPYSYALPFLEDRVDGPSVALIYSSQAAELAPILVKNSAGRLFQIRAILSNPAADTILMVFDTSAAPSDGDIPIWRALLPDPTGAIPGEVQDNFGDIAGLVFHNGLGVAISSTYATLTNVATDTYWQITYR